MQEILAGLVRENGLAAVLAGLRDVVDAEADAYESEADAERVEAIGSRLLDLAVEAEAVGVA